MSNKKQKISGGRCGSGGRDDATTAVAVCKKEEEPAVRLCWLCGKGHDFEWPTEATEDEDEDEDKFEVEYDEAWTHLVDGCACRGETFRHFHIKCYADLCEQKTDALVNANASSFSGDDDETPAPAAAPSVVALRGPWVGCVECGEPWEGTAVSESLSWACFERYGYLQKSDPRFRMYVHVKDRVEYGYFREARHWIQKRAEMIRRATEALPLAVLSVKISDESGDALLSIPDTKLVADALSYLDVPGLNSMMRTSKAFEAYVRSDGVWEPHLKRMLSRVFDTLVNEKDAEEKALTQQTNWRESSSFLAWAKEIGCCHHVLPVLGHFRDRYDERDPFHDFESLWHFCHESGLKHSEWLMHDVPLIDYYQGAGYFASSGLVQYLAEEVYMQLEMAESTNRCENCFGKLWWGDHSNCEPNIPTVEHQRRESFGLDLCRIKLFVMDYKSEKATTG